MKLISDIARPLRSNELVELVKFAPDFKKIEDAFNFVKNILKYNTIDFSNPAWAGMIEYIEKHKYFCIEQIAVNFDGGKNIPYAVREYLKIIPISSRESVAKLIKSAPLPGDMIAASIFIEIIAVGNDFNFSDSIWIDFINYVFECSMFCIRALEGVEGGKEGDEGWRIIWIVRRYFKIIPFYSREIAANLVKLAPLPGDIIAASNFIEIFSESNDFNFSDSIWVDFLNYVVECSMCCIRALGGAEGWSGCDEDIFGIVRRYFKIIPFSSREDVAGLVGVAPSVSNILAANKFIKIIAENNGFDFSNSIWVDFLNYIEKYRESCIAALKETESQDDYEVIRETSLNPFLWSDGVDQFRVILIERMKSGKTGYLKDTIHSFVLRDVCKSFLTPSSIEIVNDLIKNFSSSPHLYKSMSADNQLRIFNVFSAISCQNIFLNEESDENRLAVDYANDRMMEIMRSVKFDAEKSIKKSFSILKKAEYRVAAALINKIVKDLDFYFSKPVVAEVYSALLLPNNPDRDWVTVCGILPSIQSNFAIREGLARQFLSIGDLEKAKPHIDAVINFEPNSKTSIEIKALLAREEAIKNLVEDGVNVESIDQMTGVDFEKILIRKLQKIGFRVTETPGSGDYGADIILDDEDETRFIIQCKRFSSRVNLKAVQEVVAAMKHYSADYAIVATNNEFLKSAVELAKSNDVELWAGTKIMQVLSGDISETILATANLPKDVLNNSRA